MSQTRSDWAWVRDVPSGFWMFLATILLCATAVGIFYFGWVHEPTPWPSTEADCIAAGHTWSPMPGVNGRIYGIKTCTP